MESFFTNYRIIFLVFPAHFKLKTATFHALVEAFESENNLFIFFHDNLLN